jgi:hypothetical protein
MDPHIFLVILAGCIVWGLVPSYAPVVVILGALWLIAAHTAIGAVVLIAVVTHRVLGWAIKDYFLFLIGGFGLRASGALNSAERAEIRRERFEKRQHAPRQPRSRGRSPKTYMPWEKSGDDIEDL